MPQREQTTIVRRQRAESGLQVDAGWVNPRGRGRLVTEQVAKALATHELTSLVARDRQDPRSKACRVPQRPQVSPDLRPGRLRRVFGQVSAAAHQIADPENISMMLRDDLPKRLLIAAASQRHASSDKIRGHGVHAIKMRPRPGM
jgi:hypothetical protein